MQVVVRYHEIALKGRNRPFFVGALARNLRRATADLGKVRVNALSGRLTLDFPDGISWDEARARVQTVLGVANFSQTLETPKDMDALQAAVVSSLAGRTFASFRVTTKRSDKSFHLRSGDVDRALGAAIHVATGVPVSLTQPALTVFVEVLHDRILYSFDKLPGPGGFPVGSSGKVAVLLSGGIDSPVAAYRMLKRGCRATLVHFHAFPLQDRATIDKAQELARRLTRYQFRTRLLLVPFGPVQQTIVASCPAPLRVVLYRRMMVRIAEQIAARHHAKALVTGESLGQVASQTLENMGAIDAAAVGPILRPLVGMDKDEITVQARAIGTFDVSILPDQDCCQLFVPRSPATAATVRECEAAEQALDIPGLVATALEGIEEMRFESPGPGTRWSEPRTPRAEASR
jgi:thiamine biosynthesis protein ThiI